MSLENIQNAHLVMTLGPRPFESARDGLTGVQDPVTNTDSPLEGFVGRRPLVLGKEWFQAYPAVPLADAKIDSSL